MQISKKWKEWFNPYRFKVAYGGRVGGKSHALAMIILALGARNNLTILCLREYQKNLNESVFQLLKNKIYENDFFRSFYRVYADCIVGNKNETIFRFSGIKNANNLKSFEGADIAWVEEAQTISKDSLDILIPTIRKEGSEIWFSFNPDLIDDPIYQFVLNPRKNQLTVKVNYLDNPFCPSIMKDTAIQLKEDNQKEYDHIWLEEPRIAGERSIFTNNFIINEFNLNEENPEIFNGEVIFFRYGIDFGYSDPTAIIECFDYNDCIYINNEIIKNKLQNQEIVDEIKNNMPNALLLNSVIYADSASPAVINWISNYLPAIKGASKGQGSVKSGIRYLNSRKIVIHPRCVNTIRSLKLYQYKMDSKGRISDSPEHTYSHIPDALRYAYNDLIFRDSSDNILYEIDFENMKPEDLYNENKGAMSIW